MGNIIANLLSAEEPGFSIAIKKLEQSSGQPSMDVRLMSEIIQTSRMKIGELGLDGHDTTGEELYYALLNKVKIHDQHLAKHIGVKNSSDPHELVQAIKRVIEKSKLPKNGWFLKKSVAKKLLHQTPPEKVMKLLGYSSVESMTKRENLVEIFGAIRLIETPAWLRKFNRAYKQLYPSDFENRDIEMAVLSSERYGQLGNMLSKQKAYSFTHLKELGFIALVPPKEDRVVGFLMATLPATIHYINEIRLYSSLFKLQQVKPDFGKLLAATLNEDETVHHAVMGGNKIHWRVIQRHYGRPEYTDHPDFFQPHIQPEDLLWRRAEEQLYSINPELSFWRNLDYVGMVVGGDRPISFNLLDLGMSYYFAINYEDRIINHMQASLWNELYMRYLGQKLLENQVVSQLDIDMIDADKLML